jgi:hypothetical protein
MPESPNPLLRTLEQTLPDPITLNMWRTVHDMKLHVVQSLPHIFRIPVSS